MQPYNSKSCMSFVQSPWIFITQAWIWKSGDPAGLMTN